MGGELLHETKQVFLNADDEVIEALDPKRLDESFRVGVHVRCQRADPFYLRTLRFKDRIESCR